MSLAVAFLSMSILASGICALSGTWLVLSRRSLLAEGISHAVLPGIVFGFWLTGETTSPWMVVTAAAAGIGMVNLSSWIARSGLVRDDAALGVTFSAQFSLGILLISKFFRNSPMHSDCVIEGDLAAAAINSTVIDFGSLGSISVPKTLLTLAGLSIISVALMWVARKEMRLTIFDHVLAKRLGYRPKLIESFWLVLISIQTVIIFDIAGSILVVALMVAPAATAILWTSKFYSTFAIALVCSIIAAVVGNYVARLGEVTPSGPIAATAGVCFLISLLFAPSRGLLANLFTQRKNHQQLGKAALLQAIASSPTSISVNESEKTSRFKSTGVPEDGAKELQRQLDWPRKRVKEGLDRLLESQFIAIESSADEPHGQRRLELTPMGEQWLESQLQRFSKNV